MMKKKLIRSGNSYALVINKTLLDMLKINPDKEVELHTDGKSLLIRQISVSKKQEVKENGI